MINIDSISILHELLGCEKPKHPLITVIDFDSIKPSEELYNNSYSLNFYVISQKNNSDCELKYGRQYYDFREGSLIFTAPGQILTVGEYYDNPNTNGWMLCVHPDLIKGSSLWHKISEYSFFEYEANEALHLSDAEKETIESIVKNIRIEYSANLDSYSGELIVSNLEVLLNYAKRFYGRQFITRTFVNKDSVGKFKILLKEECTVELIEKFGQPSVKRLAQAIGYSPNYLSDMLKKETGKTAQEYIKLQVLELAENLLLNTKEPIYQIAEKLGFEQPSSFTKFIKTQLGVSPVDFRKQHVL
jgi:AraC-type DNA-binding domain-containing proteins